jgi:Na+-transporting methylmalonyl-CoA/oxaloacetate decarboxylase gamma subunit|tara:strand:- start:6564 stop:6971 length:408 start_codon:yes stop_codon:yes gene_type:complete
MDSLLIRILGFSFILLLLSFLIYFVTRRLLLKSEIKSSFRPIGRLRRPLPKQTKSIINPPTKSEGDLSMKKNQLLDFIDQWEEPTPSHPVDSTKSTPSKPDNIIVNSGNETKTREENPLLKYIDQWEETTPKKKG